MKYRPEVDGLRTVAVVPVVLFHAGYSFFSGGFVGVDVFFVISGYLITTIILDELDRGTFSILTFYERRARRILPALFLVIATCIPVALAVMNAADLRYFAQSILSVLLFVSNIFFWQQSGYFDSAVELKPLLHTWSLAVEEQFYIFFPLMAMALWRFGWKLFLGAVLILSAASFVVAYWGGYNSPSAAFYLLPTRIWELAAGSVVAIVLPRMAAKPLPQWLTGALALAGLALVAWSIVAITPGTRWPGVATVPPVLGTVLILMFARPSNLAGRMLGWGPMVGIGLISYSAYLWHQPLFAFARYVNIDSHPSPWLMGALAVLVFPLAWASWKFVEGPFRKRDTMPVGRMVQSLSVAAAALAVFAVLGTVQSGFPGRGVGITAGNFEADNKALRAATWDPLIARTGEAGYTVDGNTSDRTAWFDANDNRTPMLLVGNSHSKDLYNLLAHSEGAQAQFQIARYGVELRRALNSGLRTTPNYRDAQWVVLATRYSGADMAALPALIAALQEDGKQVAVVKGIFEFPTVYDRTLGDIMLHKANRAGDLDSRTAEVAQAVNAAHYQAWRAVETSRLRTEELNAQLEPLVTAAGVPLLDRMDYLCDSTTQSCLAFGPDLTKYIPDGSHHTLAGAEAFGPRVDAVDWLAPLRAPRADGYGG